MNHQETAKLLAVMHTVWKDNTESDVHAQTAAYQLALEDVSYQDASEAMKRCLQELVFFPKPAEIRERLPRTATALAAGTASKQAPRSAYELGYLPWPANGSLVTDGISDDVPTLADILAREGRTTQVPVPLPAAIGERKEGVG